MIPNKHPQQKNSKKQVPDKADGKVKKKRHMRDEKFSPGEPDNYDPEEFSTD